MTALSTLLAAYPVVQLRKTVDGLTTAVDVAPGQTVALGSPVVADAENSEPLVVTILRDGVPVGSYQLAPEDSAEARLLTDGTVVVRVFSGAVTVTIGDRTARVGPGLCFPADACLRQGVTTVTADRRVLRPPNHTMVPVTLTPHVVGGWGTSRAKSRQ